MNTAGSGEHTRVSTQERTDVQTMRSTWPDCLVVGLAGAILAAAWFGHFIKPHYDFYEFHEVGAALLRGELPPTFKRGPVFSILITGTGAALRSCGLGGDLAPWIGAQALNTAAMGANAALICLILLRWGVPGARWWAFSAACLPWGLYCSAQGIAEPFVVLFMLLSLLGMQRGWRGAAAITAIAALTRYDIAGLIAGLFLFRIRAENRLSRGVWTGGIAAAPLLLWVVLTLATFPARGREHYLSQIIERPMFDLHWSVQSGFRALLDERETPVPPLVRALGAPMIGLVWGMIGGLSLIGVARGIKRNDGAVIGAVCAWMGYVLVHAMFPFQIDRFGYPPAVLLLLLSAFGVGSLREYASAQITSPVIRNALLAAGAGGCILLVLSEWTTIPWLPTSESQRITAYTVIITGCTAWIAGSNALRHRAGWMTLSAACLTAIFVHMQIRTAVPLLRSGREWGGVVEAARWIRSNAEADARIVSSEAGLYRMLMPDSPRDRFIGYEAVQADTIADAIEEMRQSDIRYIVWHARHLELHDRYYFERWRLGRFEPLGAGKPIAGLEVVYHYTQHPPLWILRIRESAAAE